MIGRPSVMLAVVIGLFGHVAFFADFGRGTVPVWLRMAAHMAVVLPVLFITPPPAAPARITARGPRLITAFCAFACALYVALTALTIAFIAAGTRMPGLWLYVAFEIPGTIIVLRTLVAAARALRPEPPPPPDPLFVPPFAGAYRTRPFNPPPPPASPAPPPVVAHNRNNPPFWYLPLSALFTAGGLFMVLHPRKPADTFWGFVCTGFFGLCTWVFAAQLVNDHTGPRRAPRGALAALALLGAGAVYLGWTSVAVPLRDRALVGVIGAVFIVLAGLAANRQRKEAARQAGSVPPRGNDERS